MIPNTTPQNPLFRGCLIYSTLVYYEYKIVPIQED